MTIEHASELEGLRRAGALVSSVLRSMREAATPGIRTRELDALGAELLRKAGARSAPQLTYGFPGATCISVNEVAAHGIPDDTVLRDGDLVNVDVSAELDGYFADTGASFVVGQASTRQQRLLDAAREARDTAVARLRAGGRLNGIGRTVESVAARRGFRVIRNLGSHGTGRALHEAPEHIPGHYVPHDNRRLHEGMVITVEPFLATHCNQVEDVGDGWSLRCRKGFAAQFEHTLVVTAGEPIVVT
jgi:methionyl aminopeptidase